ncbi:hypothetical protein Zmor_003266 [Zophobas morio]|uniref:Uncharacterized protein n=1 Tax=Zophobas morio TaxID=2755281 RepID=A0AA38M1V2_9CUCU|nr:hypothetical protein Zmor_003226 [Zophobas morio]KAJ3639939.1 hypothetical protein Zmor_003266 [Zophobas morio]
MHLRDIHSFSPIDHSFLPEASQTGSEPAGKNRKTRGRRPANLQRRRYAHKIRDVTCTPDGRISFALRSSYGCSGIAFS